MAVIAKTRRIWGKSAARAQWVEFGYTDYSGHLPAGGELDDGGSDVVDAPFDPAATFTVLRIALREATGRGIVPIAEAGDPSTWGRRGVFGFSHLGGDYLIPLPAWRGMLAGQDERAAAQALARAGWLLRDPQNCLARAERIGGRTLRVYRIRAAFLADA